MINGGLSWLLRREGEFIGGRVDHSCIGSHHGDIGIGLGVYRREEGEETVNT